MERWPEGRHQSSRGSTTTSTRTRHPSFSSSLLDAIYRSIDEDVVTGGQYEEVKASGRALAGATVSPGASAVRKHIDPSSGFLHQAPPYVRGEVRVHFTAAAVMERTKTMAVTEKVQTVRRGSLAGHDQLRQHNGRPQQPQRRERFSINSTSCSSESSYSGFSSSEADSVVFPAASRPKPIRTGEPPGRRPGQSNPEGEKRKKDDSIRSRFRASKLYEELRKANTPVSPGARLASFLAKLFAASGNPKTVKTASTAAKPAGGGESGSSFGSSYSRSCLDRMLSTRGRTPPSGAGGRRSIRFYPDSDVVGEDDKPDYFQLGGFSLAEPVPRSVRVKEAPPSYRAAAAKVERKRNGEAATALVGGYTEKMGKDGVDVSRSVDNGEEEEEEDDAASNASSDLFELENLAALGGGERRFLDELPVYGTTRLETNRPRKKIT